MKIKYLILLSCLIVFLSLNIISATTSYDNNMSLNNSHDFISYEQSSNEFNEDIYVDCNSANELEDGSRDFPYKTINNENLEKISTNSIIHVFKGDYNLNSTVISKNLSIVGENQNSVIFTSKESKNIFTVNENTNVYFINFTLKDLTSDENTVILNNGNLNIENVIFSNNTAKSTSSKGACILNNANLMITNSTFDRNTASFGSSIYNNNNTILLNSEFNNNHIYNVGGAVYNLRGKINLNDCKFTNNSAVSGAAIYNAFGNLTVNKSIFLKNNAEHFYGGAIYSTGITVTNNSVFDSNHANIDGGAITNTNNFTIFNCSFVNNSANENGGVIENVPWSINENGNLTIINSSFADNSAGKYGGVIMNYGKKEAVGENATITIRNSIFDSNSAFKGGVIYNEQYVDLQYNVLLNNDADEYNVIYSPEYLIKSIDNNWWGYNNITLSEIGVMPNNWVVLKLTNTTPLITNLTTNLQVSFNNNEDETITSQIPERIVMFFATKSTFRDNGLKLTSIVNNTVNSLGDEIFVKVDNQILSLNASDKFNVHIDYNFFGDYKVGNNITITGKFYDMFGKIISNSNVKIVLNGRKFYARTGSSGVFEFVTRLCCVGVNNLSVGYSGNVKYNSFESNASFVVDKQDVIVTYDVNGDFRVGENITIKGRFTDKNNLAITYSNVKIVLNGRKFYARTGSSGVFEFVTRLCCVGVNNLSVGYSGNVKYNSFESNASFVVDKQDVIVTGNLTEDCDNLIIKGTFTDKNGRPITYSNVKIILNGNKFYSKTDGNGLYIFNTTSYVPEINNIIIGYSGNIKYNEYYTNTTFNIPLTENKIYI